METQKFYQIALSLIPNVGGFTTRQLISHAGDAEQVFKLNKKKLLAIKGIGENISDAILSKSTFKKAEEELLKMEKAKINFCFYTDKEYPQRLKTHYDSPTGLFYKGIKDLNCPRTIGIVGTREATEYGKKNTEQIVNFLKDKGICVVSGLAYGIDIAAHKAALKNNIETWAVLANGLDTIYPALHKPIANQMLENGGLISENPIGTKPDKGKFPARNRIIASISDALIVVEAAKKGGALITADIANDYNKDVFAVPGPINAQYSEGCNELIAKHKAHIFISPEKLLEDLGWEKTQNNPKANIPKIDMTKFDTQTQSIIEALLQKPLHIDEISWKTGISINKVSNILLLLELENLIEVLPGKQFKIIN